MKVRKLSISAAYRRLFVGSAIDPLIRLRGSWLRQAGFAPGAKVEVHVSEGKLVITPAQ